MTRLASLLCLVLGAGLACGGPLGPFSGGRLSGQAGPDRVADWSFSDEIENAQLEVNPADPHSVNTWCKGIGDRLYVPTSMILGPTDPTERDWVGFVQKDPLVRIRLGDTVYERRMVRVSDDAEFGEARLALEAKYDIATEDRDPERTIWIYRLDPR